MNKFKIILSEKHKADLFYYLGIFYMSVKGDQDLQSICTLSNILALIEVLEINMEEL